MRTRQLLAACALAVAAVLPAAAPAGAHGDSVHLDVTGQQNGHVSTFATWENDHDPVTEDFAGTLSATAADGRAVGPWRLVGVPGRPGTYTTREILPAGHWQVTVDCAFPSLGHAQRELDVADAVINDPVPAGTAAASPSAGVPSAGSPSAGVTAGPAPVPTVGPVPEPAPAGSASATATAAETTSDSTTWAAVGTAAAAVVLVGTGLWLRRRRRA
ncbi:hypothetical protein GCM10018790_58350 [Kitasatospora xanthocidica]|uniref:hypothetical protein n=1 Tax=Kitasatospora xanthocidica TaxID=83382 RepID=UPI00167589E0|nr:hypothetical protein [Kitasatospora xanthocidica]GHF72788.1 hypothetical protein GCM10018790_58350 [Kitasatospora xanthocidica]